MKPPALLASLLILFAAAACETPRGHVPATYTKIREMNYRGELIAEWVVKGPIWPVEVGYRIKAVERLSAPPHPILTKYPEGWKTTITGPRIERWEVGEPLWLYEYEMAQTGSGGVNF